MKKSLFDLCKENPALVDALAPEHRPGRYGSVCSDEDVCRGMDFDVGEFGKDYRCQRCLLLDAVNDHFSMAEFTFEITRWK